MREAAARRALGLCEHADAAARDAERAIGVDDDRLFSLLEQRDEMISDLAEQIAVLRSQRPTADSALYAADFAHVLRNKGKKSAREVAS